MIYFNQAKPFLGMEMPGCVKKDNPGKSVPSNVFAGGGGYGFASYTRLGIEYSFRLAMEEQPFLFLQTIHAWHLVIVSVHKTSYFSGGICNICSLQQVSRILDFAPPPPTLGKSPLLTTLPSLPLCRKLATPLKYVMNMKTSDSSVSIVHPSNTFHILT